MDFDFEIFDLIKKITPTTQKNRKMTMTSEIIDVEDESVNTNVPITTDTATTNNDDDDDGLGVVEDQPTAQEEETETATDTATTAAALCAPLYCTTTHRPYQAMLDPTWGRPCPSKAATQRILAALLSVTHHRPDRANVYGYGPLLLSNIPSSATPTATTPATSTPSSTRKEEEKDAGMVVLGIDEAGRGSVLGPMVYGCAYWSVQLNRDDDDDAEATATASTSSTTTPRPSTHPIPPGFRDSKQLNETEREHLFDELIQHPDIGYAFRSLLPSEISRNMLRGQASAVYNLNQMSHDATITLIRKLTTSTTAGGGGLRVQTAFIDTVGNPQTYRRKLETEFPNIQFVVESKADANYPPCSAASVVAKVVRDRLLQNWNYEDTATTTTRTTTKTEDDDGTSTQQQQPQPEGAAGGVSRTFGSGYPSDPKCKAWMDDLHDPVFGYNDFVRFSWAPTKKRLDPTATEKSAATNEEEPHPPKRSGRVTPPEAVHVAFRADLEYAAENQGMTLDQLEQQQQGMQKFLTQQTNKRPRYEYFEKRNIQVTESVL